MRCPSRLVAMSRGTGCRSEWLRTTTPLTVAPHMLKNVPYSYDAVVPVCQSFENVMAV